VRLGDTPVNIHAKVQALRCGLDLDGEWQWVQEVAMGTREAALASAQEGL
jgi:hypothetical protein